MNEDIIQDFKQFITATMHQEFSGVKDDVSSLKDDVSSLKDDMTIIKEDMREVKSDLKTLTNRVDDIDAKLDTVIEASGKQLDNHEQRLTKLETKTA